MQAVGPWARRGVLPVLVVWLPVIVLWAGLVWRLRIEWALSETYRYGFWVPFLVILLLFRRWKDRSSNLLPSDRLLVIAVFLGFSLLPCELIIRANPDWRAAFWIYGMVAFVGSVVWLKSLAGWNWAFRFVPGLMLLFLAIPWLSLVEQPVIQGLSRLVAEGAVEVANLSGIPADFRGNVIVLADGVKLGIKDACSGLRSFQAALMAAWFFGELVRLTWGRRAILVVSGCFIAAVLNMGRAILLVFAGAAGWEQERLDVFHDRLGGGTAMMLFLLLGLCTWALSRRRHQGRSEPPTGADARTGALPLRGAIALGASVAVSLATATLWFQRNDPPAFSPLQVNWDRLSPSIERRSIGGDAREILRYSDGQYAVWQPTDGVRCDLFVFHWDAGKISSFADVHRPEICLPASGVDLQFEGKWSASQVPLTFDTWSEGRMHVFFARWDAQSGGLKGEGESSERIGRLAKALRGEALGARQVVEILVSGAADVASARQIVDQFMTTAVEF